MTPDNAPTEVKHVTFNPQPIGHLDSPIGGLCAAHQLDGWELIRVVPHHQFEAVAVFHRMADASPAGERKEYRILWNRRGDGVKDAGDIDEIVLHGVDVHIEQMDDRCWWIGMYRGDDRWAGNFSCDSRGRMTFSEQEDDLGFDKDEEHDRG